MAATAPFKPTFLSPTPSSHLPINSHNLNKASRDLFNTYSIHGICKNIRHLSGNRKYRLSVNIPRFAHSEADVSSFSAEDFWDNTEYIGNNKDYPMVRTFENDLCRLTMIGYRSLEDAITAAAADGGLTAKEHIASGRPLMVIETIYPGYSSERSTVATRLLVPARKVLEKAKNSQRTTGSSTHSDNMSRNMLAIAFRKVVMQNIWNFELFFFMPGTYRDMDNLASSREVQIIGGLTSSDEKVLSGLAEAVCFYAATYMKDDVQQKMLGKSSKSFFQSFQKPKWMPSSDSFVRIRPLSKAEIAAHAKSWPKRTSILHERENSTDLTTSHNWWPWPSHLLSMRNIESSVWIPVHKLQIDVGKFKDVKIRGGHECSGHVWEILLSHLQLVELADVLDMYYEDPNTCPGKQLQSRIVLEAPKFAMSKITLLLWRSLRVSLAGGIALVSIIVAARLWKPKILKPWVFASDSTVQSSPYKTLEGFPANQLRKSAIPQNDEFSAEEMEAMCTLVVQKVKNSLQWPGDIHGCAGKGAWIGQNLTEWGRSEDKNSTTVDMEDGPGSSSKEVENMNESGEREVLKHAVSSKGDAFSQGHIQVNLQGPNACDVAVYEWARSEDKNPTTVDMEDGPGSSSNEVENMNESGEREVLKHAVSSKGDTFSQGHIQVNLQGPNACDVAVYEWGRSEDKNPTTVEMEDGPGSSSKEVEKMNESGEREVLKHVVSSKGDAFSQGHIQVNLQAPNACDVAVYEVTLSRNGNVLGLQPINRAAVNRWASNPLAKVLYDGKKLQPGLLESRPKFRGPPKDTVIIELLMSDDPTSHSVTARPSYT